MITTLCDIVYQTTKMQQQCYESQGLVLFNEWVWKKRKKKHTGYKIANKSTLKPGCSGRLPVMSVSLNSIWSSAVATESNGIQLGCTAEPSTEYLLKGHKVVGGAFCHVLVNILRLAGSIMTHLHQVWLTRDSLIIVAFHRDVHPFQAKQPVHRGFRRVDQ